MTPGSLSLETPAPELLTRIQTLFREWNVFDRPVSLTLQGQTYLARCDAHSFTVFCLNPHCHLPPGAPGWPVCLVSQETAADEACAPHLEEDEFAVDLTLQDWLDLIQKTIRKLS